MCPSTQAVDVVDLLSSPSCHDRLSFKGQGSSSWVIAARRCIDGKRIVWRIPKLAVDGEAYCRRSALFTLHCARLVDNVALSTVVRFTEASIDVLRMEGHMKPGEYLADDVMWATEMSDKTQLTLPAAQHTITVEVKPKEGVLSPPTAAFCANCVLHADKSARRKYVDDYAYCPLRLFSGDWSTMRATLHSLHRSPRHNLRIFVDGHTVFGCDDVQRGGLGDVLIDGVTVAQALDAFLLAFSGRSKLKDERELTLNQGSVARQLMAMHALDTMGVTGAFKLFNSSPTSTQNLISDPNFMLFNTPFADELAIKFQHYFVSASFRDSSLMFSFSPSPTVDTSLEGCDRPTVELSDGRVVQYSLSLIDLDLKPVAKLAKNCVRYVDGLMHLNDNPGDAYCAANED